ncbi:MULTISPECIES: DUF6527 family protein [Xanthomonas]
MEYRTLEHRFVRNAPRDLEPGLLYISIEYATAVHSCCCGCGERVVTPFTPTDWRMTFNGESVTLSPSVGNWNQDCRSHYVIQENRVIECGPWSEAHVEAERNRDKSAKAQYYQVSTPVKSDTTATEFTDDAARASGLWSRLREWLFR